MKKLLALAVFALPLLAQSERFHLHDFGIEYEDKRLLLDQLPLFMLAPVNLFALDYRVDRDPDSGLKTLTIYPYQTHYVWTNPPLSIPQIVTTQLTQSQAYDVGIVQALVGAFLAAYPDPIPVKIVYPFGALATTAPQLIALDGKSNDRVVTINLSTFAAKYSADLDSFSGNALGLRPSPDGSTNEVWVPTFKVGPGLQMSIVDLTSGAVVSKITTPLSATAQAVVFSSSGNAAFETVSFQDGGGALVIYDAVARTITNTITLPFQPSGTLMSPDGSTLYILGSGSAGRTQIVYYDLLSGTADLTVSLPFADGMFSPYLMHPNGRIYGQNSGQVFVYDPQIRKVISKFDLGFAAGHFIFNMQLSPDGLQLHVLDDTSLKTLSANGNIYIVDAVTGYNFGSLPIGGTSNMFFVAPAVH